MSIRTRASSVSNKYLARTLARWVFPTPVGPRKINEPIGLLGSFNPARLRRIALTTFFIASGCPITEVSSSDSILISRSLSFFAIRWTGIPVIMATTSATLSSVTCSLFICACSSHFLFSLSRVSCSLRSMSLISAASSNFWLLIACIFFFRVSSIWFSIFIISAGTWILDIWTLEPDSSSASMALSGK